MATPATFKLRDILPSKVSPARARQHLATCDRLITRKLAHGARLNLTGWKAWRKEFEKTGIKPIEVDVFNRHLATFGLPAIR